MKKVRRIRRYIPVLLLALVCLTAALMWDHTPSAVEVFGTGTENGQEELKLYARSAVLLDADSGRILYGKNEDTPMPMASTTKIMTLIVALELEEEDETASVSSYAASQPKVHLGMQAEETFYLEDLYYSLMLESHNDSAVCIAEHFGNRLLGREAADGGEEKSREAVAAFVNLMNEKAESLGLKKTFFVTPNGLDAQQTDPDGTVHTHETTAAELARIMKYCITESPKKEKFLNITGAMSYSFSDADGKRSFSCTNHNAFLQMMEGALSGKTGFTAKAGYCYVGALKRDDRTFIVALLACGWPNNRSYKWVDTRKLMNYGLENYFYQDVYCRELSFEPVEVLGGVPDSGNRSDRAVAEVGLLVPEEEQTLPVLLKEGETVEVSYEGKERMKAPVHKGDLAGRVVYRLDKEVLAEYPVLVQEDVPRLTFSWCFLQVAERYFPK